MVLKLVLFVISAILLRDQAQRSSTQWELKPLKIWIIVHHWNRNNYVTYPSLTFLIASYLKLLLTDKHENTESLIHTLQQLYSKGIDSRQLAFLKMGCVKLEKEAQGKGIKLSRFRKLFHSIMKQSQGGDDQEIFDIVYKYVHGDGIDYDPSAILN